MTEHRAQILQAIRRHPLAPHDHPGQDAAWIRYDSPRDQFAQVLQSVGGACHVVPDLTAAARAIGELPAYQQADRRCSVVSIPSAVVSETGLAWNVSPDRIDDAHALADLDFALLPGEFWVAENGAVWIRAAGAIERALYFIAQHVALVVPAGEGVHNLHEAYGRLDFADNRFGCFISGPSKTADIEQSLVIGAHGARSLTVLLVEELNAT